MAATLTCARPGCHNLFVRVTCQKYCTVECRKADRHCPRCGDSLPLDQPGDERPSNISSVA